MIGVGNFDTRKFHRIYHHIISMSAWRLGSQYLLILLFQVDFVYYFIISPLDHAQASVLEGIHNGRGRENTLIDYLFFLPTFAMLSFVRRISYRPRQDRIPSRCSHAVWVAARPGRPEVWHLGEIARRQPNSHHHGLGPALQDLLVFSRRRVRFPHTSHGWLKGREDFSLPFLPIRFDLKNSPPSFVCRLLSSKTVWSLSAIVPG